MIPHGTIERLEHLVNLIDSKKDYQDERMATGYTLRRDYELDEPLSFPPPEITGGKITEKSFYLWIEQLSIVYEREMTQEPEIAFTFMEVYGSWDDLRASPVPDSSKEPPEDDEEDLRVIADPSADAGYDDDDASEEWKPYPHASGWTPES